MLARSVTAGGVEFRLDFAALARFEQALGGGDMNAIAVLNDRPRLNVTRILTLLRCAGERSRPGMTLDDVADIYTDHPTLFTDLMGISVPEGDAAGNAETPAT